MKDYKDLVSRKAPEGLLSWVLDMGELDTAGTVYRKVWKQDTSPAAVLSGKRRKEPEVECRCSACGKIFREPYIAGKAPDGATYGMIIEGSGGAEVASSGDSMLCPCCGSPVKIRCRSRVGRDVYAGCCAWVTAVCHCMSASLLPGEPGRRPLALTGWEIRRYCTKDGETQYVCLPYDAYVFDGTQCVKLGGWVQGYGGNTGYRGEFRRKWTQPQRWDETWGEEEHIYGLTVELLEESCLHNAKLPEYMESGVGINGKYPISYLRLYQTVPAVENLVVQGAGYLLDEMLAESRKKSLRYGLPLLEAEDLDIEKARPSAMLGLDREEFRRMVAGTWSLSLYRLYRDCKETGERLGDEEIRDAFLMGEAEQLRELVGRVPIGKAIRYLYRQRDQWEELMLYDPEIDLYVDPEEFAENYAELYRDYLDSSGTAGWDLTDPAVLWPKNLKAAHDRAAEAARIRVKQESKALFRERYKALSRFTARFDGILIRPCRSQGELTNEGKALKHCVAGYAGKVARGQTAIFFLRREEEPDKPWYTLELDEKELTVKQNRGLQNCARTAEVEAFEKKWVAWLRAGAERDKDGNPVLPENKKGKRRSAA